MAYAQTALFAIQAGLRLYGASRKAYVDSIRGCALILPLPRAPGVQVDTAENWFLTSAPGVEIMHKTPRIKWLIEFQQRTEAHKAELVDLYNYYRSASARCDEAVSDARGNLTGDEMLAMLAVRQWSETEAHGTSTPLQRITGTLVNIAIDYFAQTPGVVSEAFPQGRALKAFFQALDQTDFTTVPPKEIATGLMVAVLETVSGHPQVLAGGKNEQTLITNVSAALADCAKGFLTDATDKERHDAGLWLNLIGTSILKSAAETVLAEPGRCLKVDSGAQSNVVVAVGKTITNLLMGQNAIDFSALFSAQGLDTVVTSALVAVAGNPAILKIDNKGIENIIIALAEDLSKKDTIISPEILPELVRLILAKSADNLDLLWPASQSDPREHLLVKATGALLAALSKAPSPGTTWRLGLTPSQLVELADAILDDVIDNPAWLVQLGGRDSRLQAAVEAILAALGTAPGNRMSMETGIAIMHAGIGAAALRLEFLETLPATGEQQAQTALTAAIDAIFALLFEPDQADVHWHLVRNSTLQMIVEICLDALAKHGATRTTIATAGQAVRELIETDRPLNPEVFERCLEELLIQTA
jgi:hypothetical protein